MSVSVFRCPACGALVDDEDMQCRYCRAQLATVACPGCFASVSTHARFCGHCGSEISVRPQAGASDIQCPGCRIKLVVASLGGHKMHQCERCGGLWLATDGFEKLASAREKCHLALPVAKAGSPATTKAAITYRPCPVCKRLMNRYNYARISGIILDSCRDHGLWFDSDELRQCLVFIEKGGLDDSRKREMEKLEMERRLLASEKAQTHMGMDLSAPSQMEWGTGKNQILGSVLIGAAQTLWDIFNDR